MYRLLTAGAGPIVALSTLKAHCRVDDDDTDHDLALGIYSSAAETLVREQLGGALTTEVWEATFAAANRLGELVLEKGPGVEVTKVEILTGGSYVEQDPATYIAREISAHQTVIRPTSLTPGALRSWGAADEDPAAFRVTFTAGYGAQSDVPSPIAAAILLTAADLFTNRESKVAGNLTENRTLAALLGPFRAPGI